MNWLDLFFPKKCMDCGLVGAYICSECMQKVSVIDNQKCPMCERLSVSGLTHSRCRKKYGLDGLLVGFQYRGVLRKMIKKYKFYFVSDLLSDLVELLISLADFEVVANKGPFVVVGVPLFIKKEKQRGYNQADLLAEKIADYLGWEYKKLLIRSVNTKSQSSLHRNERDENVRGVFEPINMSEIKGKRILLVDDIWTTGSTMRECGKVLKRSGATLVWGLALAA